MQSPIAIDFETYYDKEYSLRNMNTWAYVFDDRFSAYLVALHSDDIHYVGAVANAPWDRLTDRALLMHNASFDDVVLRRLRADGKIPDLKTPAVYDTADLAAYLHCRRDLKTATRELLGRTISKDVRNVMKGRTFDSVKGTDLEQAVVEYGGSDAVQCFDLWNRYSGKWPDNERRISQWNRESGFRGIKVNVELVEKVVEELETAQFNLLRNMPWYPGKPPLSRPALMKEAAKEGIPVPASLANSSEAAVEWEKTYAPKFAWVRSVRHYRRITAVLAKFRTLAGGIRDDGTYAFQLKYFGASQTGRFSGGGGFNMQNLSRLPGMICHSCWGINYEDLDDGWEAEDFNGAQCPFCGSTDLFIFHPRYVFVARDGHSFIATDYSQIEPRVLLWRVGDMKTLDMIRNGLQIYEAHARATMGWTGGKLKDEDPKRYSLAKARCLLGHNLVLTNHGYKPIVQIETTDMVWDGADWVAHSGVVCRGTVDAGSVVNVFGEGYTDTHRVFVGPDQRDAGPIGHFCQRELAAALAWKSSPSSSWADVWELARAVARAVFLGWKPVCQMRMRRMREGVSSLFRKLERRENQHVLVVREGERDADVPRQGVG